jgi:hypothetical protein
MSRGGLGQKIGLALQTAFDSNEGGSGAGTRVGSVGGYPEAGSRRLVA